MASDEGGHEHDWVLTGMRLSLRTGMQMTERCASCTESRTLTDPARTDRRRQPRAPARRLRGE